jgi:hypothetical protein
MCLNRKRAIPTREESKCSCSEFLRRKIAEDEKMTGKYSQAGFLDDPYRSPTDGPI